MSTVLRDAKGMLKHPGVAEQWVFTIPRPEEARGKNGYQNIENCGYRKRVQTGVVAFSRRTQTWAPSRKRARDSSNPMWYPALLFSPLHCLPIVEWYIHTLCPLPWDSTEPTPLGRAHFFIPQTWDLVIGLASGGTLADVTQAEALNVRLWPGLATWHACPLPWEVHVT